MADHIWIVRDPNGKVIGVSVVASGAIGDVQAHCGATTYGIMQRMYGSVHSGLANSCEQEGYTLTREPLSAPVAASEPVACNRKACRAPLPSPRWWNTSTRAYYCHKCMHAITRWPENAGIFEDHAHPSAAGVTVTEALQIAADLLTHAATSEDGIDASDAEEGVKVCRAALAALTAASEGQPCEHRWISMQNQYIKSGEMCTQCFAIRAAREVKP